MRSYPFLSSTSLNISEFSSPKSPKLLAPAGQVETQAGTRSASGIFSL